ncbi:MAG: ABC transporter permease [Streptosporangiaceae bacterium]
MSALDPRLSGGLVVPDTDPAVTLPAVEPGGGADSRLPARRISLVRSAAWQNRLAVTGLGILVLLTLFCFVGPLIYHTDQVSANLALENLPPSVSHPLGTSTQGRDELGRLMLGGQSTLEVGFTVAVVATLFGMIWGAIAGYVGGFVDAVMMRVVDAVLAIPFLFFIVLLAEILRPNLIVIVISITSVSWLSTARLVRGEVLSLRTREYVAASKSFGARHWYVIFRHLTPNVLGVVAVNATLKMADAILAYAGMAFLGLSIPPPATSWGDMLTNGINQYYNGYWWQLWPAAVAIVLIVLSVNLVGDGLHDMVERRLERR